jgi:uncharacterized MAPEG superfamily protein
LIIVMLVYRFKSAAVFYKEFIMLELTMLAASALLYQFMWLPASLAKYIAYGYEWMASNRAENDLPPLPDWGARAERAHENYFENFAPFAVAVLSLGLVDGYTYYTGIAAVTFFAARVAHLLVYTIGWVYVRTLSWAVGLGATLYLYYVLFQHL